MATLYDNNIEGFVLKAIREGFSVKRDSKELGSFGLRIEKGGIKWYATPFSFSNGKGEVWAVGTVNKYGGAGSWVEMPRPIEEAKVENLIHFPKSVNPMLHVTVTEAGETSTYTTYFDSVVKSCKTENVYEWEICVEEEEDKVLKLKVGESMYFQPNRDDSTTKGIILRTK